MRLSVKHQIFITLGVAAFILLGFALMVYRPQAQKLGSLGEEQEKIEADVESAKATVERLEEAKNELKKIDANLSFPYCCHDIIYHYLYLKLLFFSIANESGVR